MNNKQKTKNNSDLLPRIAEIYAHEVYSVTKKLPREELFGLTSQIRRAALSVPLNIIEGYARQSRKTEIQFLRIAYGSLKEPQFILQFAVAENYLTHADIKNAHNYGEQAAKLIWSKTNSLIAKGSG